MRRIILVMAVLMSLGALAATAGGAANAASGGSQPWYTVKLDSTMTDQFLGQNGGATGSFVNEYTATVEIPAPADGTTLTGSATGAYTQTSGEADNSGTCSADNNAPETNRLIDESGNPDTVRVDGFTPGASPSITINIGKPTETYLATTTDPACDPHQNTQIPNWYADFLALHTQALSTGSGDFSFTLQPGSGSDGAGSASFSGSMTSGNVTITESTTITVTENPCVVPALANMSLDSAEAALTDANCTVGAVTKKASKAVAIGNVVSSTPPEGTSEPPGTAVALAVSKGSKVSRKCKVPKLAGLKLATAEVALTKADCAVGKISYVKSKKVAKGHVVSSNPSAGTSAKGGTKVALSVSGPPASTGPAKECKVPDVVGKPAADAALAIARAGCGISKVTGARSASVPPGDVISTNPKAGTKLKKGSKVAVLVSEGP